MHCHRVQEKLSEFIDGELPVAEHSRIMDHLAHCTECRTEERAMRRLVGTTRIWGVQEPPLSLAYRLDPAVIAARAQAPERVPWLSRFRSVLVPVGGLATAAAAAALVLAVRGTPARTPAHGLAGPVARVVAPGPGDPGMVKVGATIMGAPAGGAPSVHSLKAPKHREPAVVAEGPHIAPRRHDPAVRRAPAPVHHAPIVRRKQPVVASGADVIHAADQYRERGQYDRERRALNDEIKRHTSGRQPDERARYQVESELADSAIDDCMDALKAAPGNPNARKYIEKALDRKKRMVLSLAD